MADIGEDELREEIDAILKDADLSVMSAKKVRQLLEDKLKCNLSSRKQEIDDMVMSFVNSKEDDEEEDESDEDDDDDEDDKKNSKKKPAKRPAPPKKSKAKRSKGGSSDDEEEESESEASDDDDDYEAKKPAAKKKVAAKKKNDSESDSDSDWGKRGGGGGGGGGGGAKKKAGGGGGGGRGKGGGYTRPIKLSPALSKLMGQDSMPRHEVVKRMWAMIKERNLYDPKNKQFAICDDDLYEVIGVKRFRTFGMMKYLKTHFHDK